MENNQRRVYQFGPFQLNADERLLLRSGQRVDLTPKDLEFLLLLIENRGHIVKKEEVLQQLWPETFVEEGNINRHISTIRKTLGESNYRRGYIETIPRRGYRFIAPVRVLHDEELRAAVSPADATRARAASAGPIDSLAVLPLVNTSADPDIEYLSEGIADSVINLLSRLPQLRVMARSTVARYKGRDLDPQGVAREVGVRSVLVGHLVRFGDELIVKIELVDAGDGSQLWGEQYRRKPTDLLALQEEISQKIVKKLRLRLTDEQKGRLTRRYTESAEAYQAYLMGRFLVNKRAPEGLRKSIKYFERAIELDPQYALAYVGLTDANYYLYNYHLMPLEDLLARVREAALRAVQLDPQLAEARLALAHIKQYDWDWRGMEEEYRAAIKINPNLAVAHKYYSILLRQTGRFEESFAEIRKAQELDPVSPHIISTAAGNLYYARQYDQALKEILKVIELEPSMPSGPFIAGGIFTQQGRYAEAAEAFQKAGSLLEHHGYSNPEIISNLACIYALSGRVRKARQLLSRLLERSRRDDRCSYDIALICTALGDHEQAFAYLERAYEGRIPELGFIKTDPLLDRLRPDTKFVSLLRRLGFND
jgi:TolB-like protein/Flp pilus assembly protein TadD